MTTAFGSSATGAEPVTHVQSPRIVVEAAATSPAWSGEATATATTRVGESAKWSASPSSRCRVWIALHAVGR
jgi:hypothetical protein